MAFVSVELLGRRLRVVFVQSGDLDRASVPISWWLDWNYAIPVENT